ncbi:MAG: hypothetical protein PHX88_01435 [Methanoculleus horonobensis]|nr:hypothetical protein [Methanoculleus horonobensis]MDD4251533.1 hypothetical protein [Methanoculleus horonobensis]
MTAGNIRSIGLLALILAGWVAACGAVTIGEWPEEIREGDPIHVNIDGLGAGQTFTTRIESAVIELDGRQTFEFSQNNFTMPFTLRDGGIRLEVSRAKWAALEISYPDGSTSVTRSDPPGSLIVIQKNTSIASGRYGYITVRGEAEDGEHQVTASLELNGTTNAAVDTTMMDFTIVGILEGAIPIRALVDAREYLWTTVRVVRPTPTPTPAPDTGGGGDDIRPAATPNATPTVAVEAFETFNPAAAQDGLPVVVWSTDMQMFIVLAPDTEVTTAGGERIDPATEIVLYQLVGDSIPGGFPEGTEPYRQTVYGCLPQGITASAPFIVTFPLTQDAWDVVTERNPVIMGYDSNLAAWRELQTETDEATRSIYAQTGRFDTIGLCLQPLPTEDTTKAGGLPALILLFAVPALLVVLYLLNTRKR